MLIRSQRCQKAPPLVMSVHCTCQRGLWYTLTHTHTPLNLMAFTVCEKNPKTCVSQFHVIPAKYVEMG